MTAQELEDQNVLLVQDGNHGAYRPRADEFCGPEGVAFIRASDMREGIVDFSHADHVNESAMSRIRKGVGQPGDVIFSSKGTVGKLALTPMGAPAFVCSPQTTLWRTLDTRVLDRRYLYYFMSSDAFRRQWSSRKGETDMADYTSLTAQRRFLLALPPIDVQRAVAKLLGPLDERIEHNQRQAGLLEAIASALFRSWFVDVDGRAMPSDDPRIEVGGLPDGWSVKGLDGIATYRNGLAMQKYPVDSDDWLPVLKISELRQGSTKGSERASTEVPATALVADGDVLFSWSGTLMVRLWCGGVAALNQHLFKVESEAYPKWFYYFWTLEHLPEFRSIAEGKKTTMGHIKRHHLSDARVVVPPDGFLKQADRTMGPILERMVLCQMHTRSLERLKQALLNPLLSGDLSLAGATQARNGALT
jgi:type I restriction enzyme, S subunit